MNCSPGPGPRSVQCVYAIRAKSIPDHTYEMEIFQQPVLHKPLPVWYRSIHSDSFGVRKLRSLSTITDAFAFIINLLWWLINFTGKGSEIQLSLFCPFYILIVNKVLRTEISSSRSVSRASWPLLSVCWPQAGNNMCPSWRHATITTHQKWPRPASSDSCAPVNGELSWSLRQFRK